jgi:hypothetical protein
MDTPLSIEVLFEHSPKQESINYFNAVSWTKETEAILMRHLLRLLESIKPAVKSLHINFNIEVHDAIEASSIINKVKPKTKNRNHEILTRREN